MNSSMPSIKPVDSPTQHTSVSEEAKNRANRDFADRMAQKAVEGLRKLSAQTRAAREAQNPAA
jgi:hypothetical protein